MCIRDRADQVDEVPHLPALSCKSESPDGQQYPGRCQDAHLKHEVTVAARWVLLIQAGMPGDVVDE
eukprot:7963223-Alexandrium_andersonii.AAC.1